MSDIFALDPAGQQQAAQVAASNPYDPMDSDPGAFHGLFSGVGQGLMRGGARLSKGLDILASAPVAAYEAATGQEGKYLDSWYRAVDDTVGRAVDYWTPGAAEVGAVGRVLGSFAEMVLPLAAQAGNPAALLAGNQADQAADLVRQGVDAQTAANTALIQSGATAVGFRLPFLGKSLMSRMLTGAGGNLALNTSTAALSREILKAGGYDEQAQQFNPADVEARVVDVLTGAAFGALAHLGSPRMSQRVKDALLTAENAKHFQEDTAPGAPQDLESFIAHQDAMEHATRQLLTGEPVIAPEGVLRANFEPRLERGTPEIPPELQALDEEREKLGKAYDQVLSEHAGPADDPLVMIQPKDIDAVAISRGGWDGLGDIEVKGSGYGLVKFIWRHGEASDKPIALRVSRDDVLAFPEIVRNFEPSRLPDEARGREWRVQRDGPDGTPRTIVYAERKFAGKDVAEMVTIHVQNGNPNTGARLSVERSAGQVPRIPRQGVRAATGDTASGVLVGTDGSGLAGRESVGQKERSGQTGPEQNTKGVSSGDAAKATDPITNAARETVKANPDLKVSTGETAPDGSGAKISAGELLARGDAEIAQAKRESGAFEAAVNCILGSGE